MRLVNKEKCYKKEKSKNNRTRRSTKRKQGNPRIGKVKGRGGCPATTAAETTQPTTSPPIPATDQTHRGEETRKSKASKRTGNGGSHPKAQGRVRVGIRHCSQSSKNNKPQCLHCHHKHALLVLFQQGFQHGLPQSLHNPKAATKLPATAWSWTELLSDTQVHLLVD